MCHTSEDQLPVVGSAGVVEGRDLTLVAADGNEFLAYSAVPAEPSRGVGLIVLPSANGLVPYFKGLCDRLAAEGYEAVGVDYYGRTAGLTERVEEVKIYPTNMPLVRSETADLDVAAAAGFLRSSAAVTKVVSIGFCFAGAISWRQAARGLDAAVGFYGCAEDFRASVPDLKTLTAPMLLFVAGKDAVYPPEDLLRLDVELEEAAVRHTTVVFENAPHGFFKLSDQWQEECERAWSELLAFLDGVAGFAG
jgi:carboxymethylenebutenolidase